MADKSKVYLAVDLGASSGRVVAGVFDGQRLALDEVARFENGPVVANDRMYWDLLRLWSSTKDALRAAGEKYGKSVASLGVDTWGVDFGLLGRGDELLGNPYHYRDRRTSGMMERAFEIVSREEIFAETGLQFMELNTLYQLLAMKLHDSPLLEAAERFLMIPDLMHWLLTGEKTNEYTDASTTQLLNPHTRQWSSALLDRFGLPTSIFGQITEPGARLGKLRGDVADETKLSSAEVVLPPAHDTASAVLAVPAQSAGGAAPDWCYISSGTWSLMGMEIGQPIVSEQCRAFNFTNEGGVGGTVRLLKNIAGLWLVQECRRIWSQQNKNYGWDELVGKAENSRPLVSLIDPDAGEFVAPADMPQQIREFCSRTAQPAPATEGAMIRCVLESLALRYRMVLDWLEQLTGGRVNTIHIVGGGVNNALLCQMAADATNRSVVAGPVEATAIGNVMMQAIAAGDVASIGEAREIIRSSFAVEQYTPQNPQPWDEAYGRFEKIVG